MDEINSEDKRKIMDYILLQMAGPIVPLADVDYDLTCMDNLDKWEDILDAVIMGIYEAYLEGRDSPYESESDVSDKARAILLNAIEDLYKSLKR